MKRVGFVGLWTLTAGLGFQSAALARGVSPYLPLNLEPEIERKIERVLILGDQPVMSRPIAAATVLAALPKACKVDQVLCEQVQRYLARYTRNSALTHASAEVAATQGTKTVLPDRYGMSSSSHWDTSAAAFWQPSDYILLNAGAVAYEGRTDFTGSMLSLGMSYAQLDIGYRPHWFSPLSDSSMLMSTEAPTMPSVTLSNYQPFTRLGLRYEIFDARMSKSDHIVFQNPDLSLTDKTGNPRLLGIHLSMEPMSGWSFGLNRLLQYGGAGRPSSLKDLFNGFFNPSKFDNTGAGSSFNNQFGNQEASVTSSLLFPGKVPFAFYAEYAGEDTSRGKSWLLGNASLSVGIHFPRLWERFDLTLEVTEWQDAWYTHTLYEDGMTNDGLVTGNWFGDQRHFGDNAGGHSQTIRVGYEPTFGGSLEFQYRRALNAWYTGGHYKTFQDFTLRYSRPWHGVIVGGQVDAGNDAFGDSFSRLGVFVRYDDQGRGLTSTLLNAMGGDSGELGKDKSGEIFIDAGINRFKREVDLLDEQDRVTEPKKQTAHFAIGARRAASEHNDLGSRVEYDNIAGHSLIGVRLVDWRYRFDIPVAFGAYLGAARYNLATPAYGFYYGVGLQWRNVLPGWDIGADLRYDDSIARDRSLPGEPLSPVGRPDSFYDITSIIVSISRHF